MILERIKNTLTNIDKKDFLFEINDEETQKKLISVLTKEMEQFVTDDEISDYKIICNGTNNFRHNEICADVYVYFAEAESWKRFNLVIKNEIRLINLVV